MHATFSVPLPSDPSSPAIARARAVGFVEPWASEPLRMSLRLLTSVVVTNAVVHGGVAHFKSDGALTVLSHLPRWRWTRALLLVPKPLRDAVYNLVARNRYRIFGKYAECFVPDADMRARVME